jgi:hypothetical protein
MSINRVDHPEEVLRSNETREFFILTDENEDGQLTLSIRRIEYMRAWERVRQLQQEDATVRSACSLPTGVVLWCALRDYGALFPVLTSAPASRRKTWWLKSLP